MKIDKEKFNKLKQLDRIEFRQKFNRIEDMGSSLINVLWSLVIIISIFMTGFIISENIAFVNLLVKTLLLFSVIFFIELVMILTYFIIRVRLKRELIEEYFLIEVKK